jgi:hypothetical protein
MATTIEIFLAGLALIINTIAIFVLYFVNNASLGPFIKALEAVSKQIGGPLSLGDFTYLFPFIFWLLLIFEVICIIAFVVVAGRRTVYDDLQ